MLQVEVLSKFLIIPTQNQVPNFVWASQTVLSTKNGELHLLKVIPQVKALQSNQLSTVLLLMWEEVTARTTPKS